MMLTPTFPLIACSRIEVFPHFLAPHTTTLDVFPISHPTHLDAPGMCGLRIQLQIFDTWEFITNMYSTNYYNLSVSVTFKIEIRMSQAIVRL